MFHAGEARRQAGELAGARTLLDEVALIVDREGVAGTVYTLQFCPYQICLPSGTMQYKLQRQCTRFRT